jgi:hypothetical protein
VSHLLTGIEMEAVARTEDFAQLNLTFVDHIQWCYEVIRARWISLESGSK